MFRGNETGLIPFNPQKPSVPYIKPVFHDDGCADERSWYIEHAALLTTEVCSTLIKGFT